MTDKQTREATIRVAKAERSRTNIDTVGAFHLQVIAALSLAVLSFLELLISCVVI